MDIEVKHVRQSDNLGLCRDPKTALTALALARSFEAGTAMVAWPQEGGVAVKRGDKVAYRALAGDIYEAEIIGIWPETIGAYVDLDVIVPGCEERVRLKGVRYVVAGR